MSGEAVRFVLTGTSGTGKTALLEALEGRGFRTFEEPVRAVLTEELAQDGEALPAKDPALFLAALLERMLSGFDHAAEAGGITFHDRGLPDLIAYADRFGVEPAPFLKAATENRYANPVFLLAPWREIFATDALRGHPFEFYQSFHEAIKRAYETCGYDLLDVPQGSVEERAAFVLSHSSPAT